MASATSRCASACTIADSLRFLSDAAWAASTAACWATASFLSSALQTAAASRALLPAAAQPPAISTPCTTPCGLLSRLQRCRHCGQACLTLRCRCSPFRRGSRHRGFLIIGQTTLQCFSPCFRGVQFSLSILCIVASFDVVSTRDGRQRSLNFVDLIPESSAAQKSNSDLLDIHAI